MNLRPLVGCLFLLSACGKRPAEAPPPIPEAPALVVSEPWSWHPLGGLAVVEGEVAKPTDLILEGRSIRAQRFAEPGPVRWEFFRPPEGESAVLRDEAGHELARFTFTLRPPMPRPPPAAPRLARKALPAAPRPPAPEPHPLPPPAPHARAVARLDAHSLAPLTTQQAPPGKPLALPLEPLPQALARKPQEPASATLPLIPPAGLWPGAGEALNLLRGRSGQKRLVLSFDGGSNAEVAAEVLDLLKARGVHTTIFLTGAFIQHFPALVRRMAAEGHELGNHTMTHPHFAPGMKRDPRWTKERVQRELLEADAALVKLLGRPMDPLWRAPYGEQTAEIRRWAEEVGYRHVGWSEGADTLDWATPKEGRLYRSGDAIVQRLEQRLNRDGDGLIVLMHLGSGRVEGDRPTKTLGAFMDRACKAGWIFVTAGSFIHDLGKPTWDRRQRLAMLGNAPSPGR